jgi:hypothetical protein
MESGRKSARKKSLSLKALLNVQVETRIARSVVGVWLITMTLSAVPL